MKKWFLAFCIFISSTSFAQTNFNITHGPYLQNMGENEVTICWVTSQDAVSWVEIAPDDDSHYYAVERPQHYQTQSGKRLIGKIHQVKVSGLQPGTSYRYRIYSKEVLEHGNWHVNYGATKADDVFKMQPHKFTTLNTRKPSTTFTVVNDIHEDRELFSSLFSGMDRTKTDFVVFNGDMVSNMFTEEQVFEGFVDVASEEFATDVPFFLARGNHETRGQLAYDYLNYFPTSTGETYYTFQSGPVFFTVLDGGEDKPDSDIEYHGLAAYDQFRREQARWLQQVVECEAFRSAAYRIVFIHIPPAPADWHGDLEIERLFVPILNQANIDLMLCGHTHKHQYVPAGTMSCNFPVLINCNRNKVEVTADTTGIRVQVTDAEQKPVEKFSFPKR